VLGSGHVVGALLFRRDCPLVRGLLVSQAVFCSSCDPHSLKTEQAGSLESLDP
jgi:hypothetical protein